MSNPFISYFAHFLDGFTKNVEIGKEYDDCPRGTKSENAAKSPFPETILRKYASKYREMKKEGQIQGKTLTRADLRKTRISKKSKAFFPRSE